MHKQARLSRGMRIRLACGAAIAALVCLAAPAFASAEALWVAKTTTVSGNGTGCTAPGYNAIQAALEKAPVGATVEVCSGTYEEQLQITQAVTLKTVGAVTVRLPSSPANSTTACDTAPGTEGFQPDQELIAVCGTGIVKIIGPTLEALWPAGTCDESLFGILVGGGAELKLSATTLRGAGAQPINGCQGGVGIQVGMAWTNPVEVGKATLSNDTISEYQKNGVTVDGAGSKATITSDTITGAGETPETAQNGVQVSNGAFGKISKTTISGNECNNASCSSSPFSFQATGVLFFGAAAGSSVVSSTIDHNDIGVFYEDSSPTPPTKSQASVTSCTLEEDRYESVLVSQGWATVKKSKLIGGRVGITILQFNDPSEPQFGESYGPKATASEDTVSGMSQWAVLGATNIAGTTEKEQEEQKALAGFIKIKASQLSGNPGPTVAESVHSESPTLAIFTDSTDS